MLRGMKSFGREKHGGLGAVPIHMHVGRFPVLMELREVGRAADDRQSSGADFSTHPRQDGSLPFLWILLHRLGNAGGCLQLERGSPCSAPAPG